MESPMQWLGGKIVGGIEGLIIDYINVLPILFGISFGVYALVGMISKSLARIGVVGVFLYGALITIS